MRLRSSKSATVLAGALITVVAASTGDPAAAASPPPELTPPPSTSPSAAVAARGSTGETGDVGRWTVVDTGSGEYQLSWTSPTALPVSDARPEITSQGSPIGLPTLSADGRTVTVTIDADIAPVVDDLDVVLSGQVLDESDEPAPGPPAPYVRPQGLAELDEDPGLPGAHAIKSEDYTLAPVKLPDIPLKAEMLGHVVEPVDATNNSPLVLFLHGRHTPCYRPAAGIAASPAAKAPSDNWRCRGKNKPVPSYLGYDYVQRLLASQGYVTVSISANAINDLDWNAADGGAAARAALIRAHLNAWVTFVDDSTHPADLSDVVLVGHSRGGEGVNRASVNLPVDAPYDVTGQVLIGPTDFGFQTSPYVPTVTILPYCDGDVSDLQGQTFTDASRDLVADPVLHSSILVMGANHNFFNSEWTPGISTAPSFDDWFGNKTGTCGKQNPSRLSAAGQRKVGKSYIAGAVHLFADGDQALLPMFDGSAVTVPSADNADVRSHAIGGGLEIRRPGVDSTLSSTTGAVTRLCLGQSSGERPTTCDPGVDSVKTPHWPGTYTRGVSLRRAFEMSWSAAGQEGGLSFDDPWDLSDASSLDLRTIVDPVLGKVDLGLRFHDADGRSSDVVSPEAAGRLLPLPGGSYSLGKRWAQTLRVPLASVAGIDLSAVTGVDLVSMNADGRVWVLDMSSAPAAGPAPPEQDVSTISVGRVTVDEGNGKAPSTLAVPYTVSGGELTEDATVRVVEVDDFGGTSGKPYTMTVPAGAESGTIDVEYQPNTIDDPDRRRVFVAVYAVHGIETDRYIGGATVVDDDPAPKITIAPVSRRVTEGRPAEWKVTMSAITSYYVGVVTRPVRAGVKGKQLTVGDLPKRFRERHFFPVPDLDTPLAKSDLKLYESIRPGKQSITIKIPTITTKADEGRRAITLRFRIQGVQLSEPTKTVFITDGR